MEAMEGSLCQFHKADAKLPNVVDAAPSRDLCGENNHDNNLQVGDYYGLVSVSLRGMVDLATGARRLCGT